MKRLFGLFKLRCGPFALPFITTFCLLQTRTAGAVNLSTTNTDALPHFWSAIESSNRPVTVVSFGDSMADSYRSVGYHLMNRFISRFGSAGYSFNNYRNTALWNFQGNATARNPDHYFWFTGYGLLPAGSAIWWENQPSPGGVLSDQAGLYYISQTNGGTFRLLLSTNGGPWTTALELEGYSLIPQGHFTNISLPLNQYRLRVEGDTGTNFILNPSLIATHNFGIHAAFIDWPGIDIGNVTNVPLSIRQPIFSALNPDLIIWHWKEEDNAATSGRMAACETWWSNTLPNCDIIYVGSPWISADTNSTTTLDRNTVIRNTALTYHRAYADLLTPTFDYPWLLTNGFMADGVHLNSSGGYACANILWDDMGFFALGTDRRLTLQQSGNQLQLTYHTSASARYRLEISTNLLDWSGLLTNPVAAATFTTNFAAPPGPNYYRLGLTPP